jgi:hypothetical protein
MPARGERFRLLRSPVFPWGDILREGRDGSKRVFYMSKIFALDTLAGAELDSLFMCQPHEDNRGDVRARLVILGTWADTWYSGKNTNVRVFEDTRICHLTSCVTSRSFL